MKIKDTVMSYNDVLALKKPKKFIPKKPSIFFRTLLKVASSFDLKATSFKYETFGLEKLLKNEPALILMNHSSFIDLKIASSIFYPRPLNIICTNDGFVGKEWLMRNLGCIPTKKFATDVSLVKNMLYAVNTLKSSILIYPEASYSFDGTATPLPDSLGKCIKMLKVPVIMVKTFGAFLRDPLYNNLRLRNVKVSANVEYLLSPNEIEEKSVAEINDIVKKQFTFDNFRWQLENKIKINENFRADGISRVLYRCPNCQSENNMVDSGIELVCENCKKEYYLSEYGEILAKDGKTLFSHIPDWYRWERECVKKEIELGEYKLQTKVDIKVLRDFKSIYSVGSGVLTHTKEGFHLVGCDGLIDIHNSSREHYSLYADYNWYEIGDVIALYKGGMQYYCFPKDKVNVAKVRLATEEIYKLK